jgi:ribonuclease HII
LRVGDTDVGYWHSKGTLYGARSRSESLVVSEAWRVIASLTPAPYVAPSRPLLVGLDESGTTEPVGPPFIVAAVVPAAMAPAVWDVIELADTKGKRHPLNYWTELLDELLLLQARDVEFIVPDVPLSRCTSPGAKPLLDAVYREILASVFADRSPGDCRVVIDNYGVGPSLCDSLMTLHLAGAEVIPSPASGCPRDEGTQADDRYVEVRAASVMARYRRELFLAGVPDDVPIGTMNAEFKGWLQARRAEGSPEPTFLKAWAAEFP